MRCPHSTTLTNGSTSTSYTYNAVNPLQNGTISGTATTYTYDANGNTLTDQAGAASSSGILKAPVGKQRKFTNGFTNIAKKSMRKYEKI